MTAAVSEGDPLDVELSARVRRAIEAGDGQDLVPLLEESAPLYQGRSARRVARIRGFLLAAFEKTTTPVAALPFVLDELQNGRDAHAVGGAAVAVRGIARPDEELTPFLLTALRNVRHRDDALVLSTSRLVGHAASYTTAVSEIVTTLGWLGPRARPALETLQALLEESPAERAQIERAIAAIASDPVSAPTPAVSCCASRRAARAASSMARLAPITEVTAVDQSGRSLTLGAYYAGRTSLVGFFYTRCDNPNKCSLTVTRLAALRERLDAENIDAQVSAMTYDPAYDRPPLLKSYGASRGFRFSDADRFLRVEPTAFPRVVDTFELGVSYVGSVVSQHRIELYVVRPDGRIDTRFTRLQWDEEAVVAALR